MFRVRAASRVRNARLRETLMDAPDRGAESGTNSSGDNSSATSRRIEHKAHLRRKALHAQSRPRWRAPYIQGNHGEYRYQPFFEG